MSLMSGGSISIALVLFAAGTFGAIHGGEGAEAPAVNGTLLTAAEMRALSGTAYNLVHPISLSGIVTLVDVDRNMLVVQDATGAVALHPDPGGIDVRPGQQVSLKATDCFPYVSSFPGYPFHPVGRDVRPTFEAPDNEGDFRLNRMRGWVRPPASGYYSFWVSSDDSSDLWLSTSADPTDVHRIAFVPTGQWTGRREWTRFRSQHSERVLLQADKFYYIEALQEQQLSDSHIAVAWDGPNLQREVIDGRYLVPWHTDFGTRQISPGTLVEKGILREYWTDFAVGNTVELTRANAGESNFTTQGTEVSVRGDGAWPEPRVLNAGQLLLPEDLYRWVKGEGEVRFIGSDGVSARIELAGDQNRLVIRVAHWHGSLPSFQAHLHAKFAGVCEAEIDANGRLTAGLISVPSERELSFFEEPDGGARVASASSTPPAPNERELGGYYFARGVVTFDGLVLNKKRVFVQDGLAGVSISQEAHPLTPSLRLGQFVEIGGRLRPGRFSPSILPLGVNILGWQNLPVPTILSSNTPPASYRDGQWSQIDGIVRSVAPDNTLVVMGRQAPLSVWVGESSRHDLEGLVDSVVRIRGVMSLDTLDSPVLLSPSRSFVATMEAAPELPLRPVAIASLYNVDLQPDRAHRVKLTGTVTYCNARDMFLQDESTAVRVRSNAANLAEVGSTVEVVGFPNREGALMCLTEASWKNLGAHAPVEPENWDLQNSERVHDGTLVRIEGRLSSQRSAGSVQTLELQTNQRTCEVILETSHAGLPTLVVGSTLVAVGVCTESAPALVSVRGASESRLASLPIRILLRDATDVAVLRGPPWWTWPRTVVLVSVLLALIAGSLLRLRFQHRRFARQQATRLAFTREILEKQEGERRRIAASLHDSLGQDLLVIRNQTRLAIQAAGDPASLRQRLADISDTTLQALSEVREITHNLRPYQLDRLGLTQAIRAIIRKMTENSPIALACHLDDIDGLLDKEAEIHIYRIVQEGMNNVVKHSEATEVTVVVKNVSGALSISIRDNGRGLVDNAGMSDTGFGLSGIRERVEILGGTTKIESAPGQGANLQIEVPIPAIPNRSHS